MTKLKTSFLTLLSLGAFITGCSTSELDDNGLTPTTSGVNISVSLAVKCTNSFAQSRAVSDDTWDDNDPPQEDALGNESAIASALIVIYESALNDVDNNSTETVKYVHTINGATATFAMPESLIGDSEKTYHALAVANPPSGLSITTSTTLGALRQMTVSSVCQGTSVSTAYNFVMSSDQEVSFTIPARSSLTEVQTVVIQTMTVERLAARVDISFGDNELNTSDQIVLPVYDKNKYAEDGVLLETGDTYTVKSLKALNVNDASIYLLQRNSNGIFNDESWQHITGESSGYYANKTLSCPNDKSRVEKSYSLKDVIDDDNNLYTTTSNIKYYTLGYYMELTKGLNGVTSDAAARENLTTVRLVGEYYRAADLKHGTSKTYDLDIDYCIRHCHVESGSLLFTRAMAYAIGRNTIYRLRIDRVFSDGEYVFIKWYYDSDNNGEYDDYTPTTPFEEMIPIYEDETVND